MSNFNIKHVMVMGAGAVGGYFGAKIAEGTSLQASLVARGPHLESIQKYGLRIESTEGDFVLKAPASDNPADLPIPGLVLFSVKSHDTKGAIEQLRPALGENTQVLPLQNGIENIPALIDAFGEERVMHSLCRVGAQISGPGVISITKPGSVIIGERDGRRSDRVNTIKQLFDNAGVKCRASSEIEREIWLKFAWNSIFNMITAAENKTTDYFYKDGKPDGRLWKLADEILKVANAENVNLQQRDLDKIVTETRQIGAFVTSTLHDRRMGKPLENNAFTGAMLRFGTKHNLSLPEFEALHQQLESVNTGKVPG